MFLRRSLLATLLLATLTVSLPGLAQTLDFDVLVDIDQSAATGCSVTPSGGATLDGFEQRVRAVVDRATFEVIRA